MKKIILTGLLFFGLVSIVYAGDSVVTVKKGETGKGLHLLEFQWVASSSNAGVSPTKVQGIRGKIVRVATIADNIVEPTDFYDLYLYQEMDDTYIDLLGGAGEDRRGGASPEQVKPAYANGTGDMWVMSDILFTITGNSVNNANGTVKVYYVDP
jgi:hypothetical protein